MKIAAIMIVVWLLFLATLMLMIQQASPAEPPKIADDVLIERKNAFQSEMRRLDAEWKLIPYQYRELDEKVRVIDQELAKRGAVKAPAKEKTP